MLDHIRGTVEVLEPTRVVLRSGGLGFDLLVPLSTSSALALHAETTLYTHVHISENPRLLGFATQAERDFCRRLLKVAGIGPSIAVGVLSHAALPALKDALARGDEERLTSVRGVGRKTAQRMILDLGEEMRQEAALHPAGPDGVEGDACAALVALGFKEKDARTAIARARKGRPEAEAADLIRAALSGG